MTVPDLVVVGNLVVDDLVFEDGTTRMRQAGGAVVYAALGAALWGVRAGIVSLAGRDYPQEMLDSLALRNIDLHGVQRLDGPGLRVWLLYEPVARHLVHRLGRPRYADVSPRPGHVPEGWRRAAIIHLTPAPLDIQSLLVRDLAAEGGIRLSLDPHTPVTAASLPEWRKTLSMIDAFFVSDAALQVETMRPQNEEDDGAASLAVTLLGPRLQLVALKRGERAGTLLVRDSPPLAWTPRARAVVDPTGAGDAFAGGFLAAQVRGLSNETALRCAVVSASFALEDWGAAALLAATPDAARQRLREWYGEHSDVAHALNADGR
jgi:sugar/nucleoside kinase (ribokinase family)